MVSPVEFQEMLQCPEAQANMRIMAKAVEIMGRDLGAVGSGSGDGPNGAAEAAAPRPALGSEAKLLGIARDAPHTRKPPGSR